MNFVAAATFRVRADADGRRSEDDVTTSTVAKSAEKSEVDRLMEGISFGQLCDEFECISSPAVERTARQLVKDIMEIREGQRSLSNFAVNVEYKVHVIIFHWMWECTSHQLSSNALLKLIMMIWVLYLAFLLDCFHNPEGFL